MTNDKLVFKWIHTIILCKIQPIDKPAQTEKLIIMHRLKIEKKIKGTIPSIDNKQC